MTPEILANRIPGATLADLRSLKPNQRSALCTALNRGWLVRKAGGVFSFTAPGWRDATILCREAGLFFMNRPGDLR